MRHTGAPGKSFLESYLWDVKPKLCPAKTCPPTTLFGLRVCPKESRWGIDRKKDCQRRNHQNSGTCSGILFRLSSNRFFRKLAFGGTDGCSCLLGSLFGSCVGSGGPMRGVAGPSTAKYQIIKNVGLVWILVLDMLEITFAVSFQCRTFYNLREI